MTTIREHFNHFVERTKEELLEISDKSIFNYLGKRVDIVCAMIPGRTLGPLINKVIKALPFFLAFSFIHPGISAVFAYGYFFVYLLNCDNRSRSFEHSDFHRHYVRGISGYLLTTGIKTLKVAFDTLSKTSLIGGVIALGFSIVGMRIAEALEPKYVCV